MASVVIFTSVTAIAAVAHPSMWLQLQSSLPAHHAGHHHHVVAQSLISLASGTGQQHNQHHVVAQSLISLASGTGQQHHVVAQSLISLASGTGQQHHVVAQSLISLASGTGQQHNHNYTRLYSIRALQPSSNAKYVYRGKHLLKKRTLCSLVVSSIASRCGKRYDRSHM